MVFTTANVVAVERALVTLRALPHGDVFGKAPVTIEDGTLRIGDQLTIVAEGKVFSVYADIIVPSCSRWEPDDCDSVRVAEGPTLSAALVEFYAAHARNCADEALAADAAACSDTFDLEATF